MPHRFDSNMHNDALDAASGGLTDGGATFISEHGTYGGADGWADSFSDPWGGGTGLDGGFTDPGLVFDPGPGIDAGVGGGDPWAGADPAWAVGGDAPHDHSDPALGQDGAVLGDPALGGGDPAWALPGDPSLTSDLGGPAPGTPTPIAGPTAEGSPTGGAPGAAPGEFRTDSPEVTRDPYQPFMDILACGVIGAAAGQVGGAVGAVIGAPLGPFAPFIAGALAFEARVLASEICLDAGRNGSTDTGGGNISDIIAP